MRKSSTGCLFTCYTGLFEKKPEQHNAYNLYGHWAYSSCKAPEMEIQTSVQELCSPLAKINGKFTSDVRPSV